MCDQADLSKCCKCVNPQCCNIAEAFRILLEYCKLFFENACNLAKIYDNKKLKYCRAYRCCSAFNEGCLICQAKLNILGRIVFPDKVALGSSAVICYRTHTEKVSFENSDYLEYALLS